MKNILFIANTSLKDPKRGTPLRMRNIAIQIAKENNLIICALDINSDLKKYFLSYPGENSLKRLLYFLKIIKKNNIDIVFANTDMEIRLPVFIKLFSKVKIIIDLHGLFAEEMYYYGLTSNAKRFLVDKAVKFLLHFYDLVFVASDKLKEYYNHVNSNIKVIYNGVNIAEFHKENIESPDIFTIGYTGNMKPYQGFNYLLQAVKNIKDKNLFKFKLNLVISSGTKEIKSILEKYNLYHDTNLFFKIGHKKVNEIMNQSSVLVASRPSLKMTEYAYPSKLPEYLATGIPAITTDVGPVNKLFGESNCCFIIGVDNITKNLERALVKVYQMNQEERNVIGRRAIDFISNNLTWDILGRKINQYLQKV